VPPQSLDVGEQVGVEKQLALWYRMQDGRIVLRAAFPDDYPLLAADAEHAQLWSHLDLFV
jgi:hypothetical protein